MTTAPPPMLLLVSYAYANTLPILERSGINYRLMIDSGGLTAHRVGKRISLDDYCAFLKDWAPKVDGYVSLDVPNNPEASHRNYQLMRDKGFDPLPVFVRGMPWSRLDDYAATSKWVAVAGGRGQLSRCNVAQGVADKSGARMHMLGVGNIKWLASVKPYSSDSSAFANGQQWGLLSLFHSGCWLPGMRRDMGTVKRAVARVGGAARLAAALSSYGISMKDMRSPDFWRHSRDIPRTATVCTARGYVRLQRYLRRHIGVRYYLAITSSHIKILTVAINLEDEGIAHVQGASNG